MRLFYRLLLLGLTFVEFSSGEYLETIAQWPLLNFAFPSYDPAFRQNFQADSTVPTGFEISWERIFVTIPRLMDGVPATLTYFNRAEPLGSSPLLQPYPSWDWHTAGKGDFNCSNIISVYRTKVDSCNRLWILDSGINTSLQDFRVVCPPKIMIFDLQTDRLVRSYVFPRSSLRPNSLFTNLVIDESGATSCDNVMIYITDTAGAGIVVYDAGRDASWRFLHSSMLPNPDYTIYQIGDDTFELFDGIIGLALSPRTGTVFYQPLATDKMFSVPTSVLKRGPMPRGETLPVTMVGRKSSQGLALEIDQKSEAIIFSPLTETAIASWIPRTNHQRIMAFSPEKLQFVADIRWGARDNGNIWAISTRFQKFFLNGANPQDINIRIMRLRPEVAQPQPPPIARISTQYVLPQYTFPYYNNSILNY